MSLPELPEPNELVGSYRDWYTASQMRAYAEEAVKQEREACAAVCNFYGLELGDACAYAIRARATMPQCEE